MKTLGRIVLLGLVLIAVAAVVFYERPLWVQLQVVHLDLAMARIQSNYVATPEGRVHYYEAEPRVPGGGTPLVLVHGLGDRAESWMPMLRDLKRAGFHVYAPDLLGSGRSPKPADAAYTIAGEEAFVADFIQSIGLQRPDIGGWSMGGYITLKLALDHPELVNRVVVYDAAGVAFQRTYGTDIFQLKDPAAVLRLQALLEPSARQPPAFVLRDVVRTFSQQQWIVDREMTDMLSGRDALDARLPSLENPLLIVWGSEDKLLPVSVGERIHALDPRSQLQVIDGCGHLAARVCATRVAAVTARFLHAP